LSFPETRGVTNPVVSSVGSREASYSWLVLTSGDDNPDRPRELEALRREIESLRIALETRTVIANATGLLMGVGNVTAAEAFEQLRRASQRTNQKLRELAAAIIQRHEEQVRVSRMRPQTHRKQIKED
jgi:hypothetical protein